jgi:hypothetical protein
MKYMMLLIIPLLLGFSDVQIANSIYWAEGGNKTNHPYGILVKYKNTSPRQACLNTIAHARRDWNGKGDFLGFLAKRYCPIGAKNDPTGLNKNWLTNVRFYLQRGAHGQKTGASVQEVAEKKG